jgi:hypothetical protein
VRATAHVAHLQRIEDLGHPFTPVNWRIPGPNGVSRPAEPMTYP